MMMMTMMMLLAPPLPSSHVQIRECVCFQLLTSGGQLKTVTCLFGVSSLLHADCFSDFLSAFLRLVLLSLLWYEHFSRPCRFHVSMGTAASKRRNLRNDAISSVAAKVR